MPIFDIYCQFETNLNNADQEAQKMLIRLIDTVLGPQVHSINNVFLYSSISFVLKIIFEQK